MAQQQDQRSPGHAEQDGGRKGGGEMRQMYVRFGAMIATSTVVMYLLTYLNVFDVAHIHFSEERLYMALTMGGTMGLIMLGVVQLGWIFTSQIGLTNGIREAAR